MSEDTRPTEEPGVIAYLFSNDTSAGTRLLPMLRMLYQGVYENTVGIMEARDKDTGNSVLMFVGVVHEEDGTSSCVPIARLVGPTELDNLELPDGQGGWMDVADQWKERNGSIN